MGHPTPSRERCCFERPTQHHGTTLPSIHPFIHPSSWRYCIDTNRQQERTTAPVSRYTCTQRESVRPSVRTGCSQHGFCLSCVDPSRYNSTYSACTPYRMHTARLSMHACIVRHSAPHTEKEREQTWLWCCGSIDHHGSVRVVRIAVGG